MMCEDELPLVLAFSMFEMARGEAWWAGGVEVMVSTSSIKFKREQVETNRTHITLLFYSSQTERPIAGAAACAPIRAASTSLAPVLQYCPNAPLPCGYVRLSPRIPPLLGLRGVLSSYLLEAFCATIIALLDLEQ
ncbi:hypothetical protein SAMN02745866_00727 [Alteromonadaceae bacterium Bs31]|nr:hypothetical protein SAMN02745866_00727 [Alteromonadaceae bacterium Bs31]